jgi:divalent metal cation (Fe/Co/Zn/Cd) transporter
VLLWRLKAEQRGRNVETVEKRALKVVAVSFFLLAAYVTFDAIKTLATKAQLHRSFIGIAISVLSLIVMPLLAKAKRRTASQLK